MPDAAYEARFRKGVSVPVIPLKTVGDEMVNTGFNAPRRVMAELDLIAEEEGRSRNEVLLFLIDWGLAQHWLERGKSRPVDRIEARAAAKSVEAAKREKEARRKR